MSKKHIDIVTGVVIGATLGVHQYANLANYFPLLVIASVLLFVRLLQLK